MEGWMEGWMDEWMDGWMDGWTLPDSLIREPSSITLVVSVIISSLELFWSGNGGTVLDAGCLGLLKCQGVAGGDGSVVEHNTCETQKKCFIS